MSAKIPARFTNVDAARSHLEKLLWVDGRSCPHCGTVDNSTALKGKSTRPGVYWCNACQKPFSVTVGTVMESSKIPLNIWLYVNHLLNSSKKGISAHQIARMVGITYKSAWFLCHRLREAMKPASNSPLGGEGKAVEVDETYFGTKPGVKRKGIRGGSGHKHTVVSLVERGGKVRSFYMPQLRGVDMNDILGRFIRPDTNLKTDELPLYAIPAKRFDSHETVNHGRDEYVRGTASTNTVEGVFSIFKRGMIGTYQHCGEQHLQRYLAEFDFRYSNRIKLGVDDASRADIALKGITGKRLTYRRTSSN